MAISTTGIKIHRPALPSQIPPSRDRRTAGPEHHTKAKHDLMSDPTVFFLSLETSCDETAAAVFTDEPAIRSSVIASQTDLHARFGGVVPEVAARAHMQRLLPVLDEALRQASIALGDIGCIAVHN